MIAPIITWQGYAFGMLLLLLVWEGGLYKVSETFGDLHLVAMQISPRLVEMLSSLSMACLIGLIKTILVFKGNDLESSIDKLDLEFFLVAN